MKYVWYVPIVLLGILMSPLTSNLFLDAVYQDRVSTHPASPHVPARFELQEQQISDFARDGVIVLRDVLPQDLREKLAVAGTDLMEHPVMHCELTKFTGPPIFHGYKRYCGRAQLVHDFLRDVVYTSPLTNMAAQLLRTGETEPMRQIADVFMGGGNMPQRWHSDFPAFSQFSTAKDIPCNEGLIFWMPLEDSYRERNGMMFLNGSSAAFKEHFSEHPETAYDIPTYLDYIEALPKDPYFAPTLTLGDVIAFDQCSVHTASGIFGGERRAYQLRFATKVDFALLQEQNNQNAGPSIKFPGPPIGPGREIASPQLWPHTLPREDAVRAKGHVSYSRKEWLAQMASEPLFALFTNFKALKTSLMGDPGGSVAPPKRLVNLFQWMKGDAADAKGRV